jgi:serine protease AprX
MAAYSSNGPTWYDGLVKPDVVAPGHFLGSEAAPNSSLYKTYRSLREKGKGGKDFMKLSGTSMSAGVVTGVVAVLKQANHKLTPNLAKAALQYTAIPMHDDGGAVYSALRQGTGEVNALGAALLVYNIDASITSTTTPWVSISPFTTIGNQTYAWAKNIVWGDNVVWGDSVYYNLPIFGLNIVWGDNVALGTNVVWGDRANIVWGNNIVWGENVVWGDNIVWGNLAADNIVWGNSDNIVWGNSAGDNIVWGNRSSDDNIVWGNRSSNDDNIVWGNKASGNNGKGGKQ